MKLLFDQNISSKLIHQLKDLYPDSKHVKDLNLEKSDDKKIWNYAQKHGFTIVSKDEDFHQMSFLYGAPPKIIWVKLGNCTTEDIEQALRDGHYTVDKFINDKGGTFLVLLPKSQA